MLVDASSRRWVFRFMQNGRRRDIGLGSLHDVTLSEAREEARRLRKVARAGGDPLAERRRSKAPVFESAARECHADRAGVWRSDKHAAQWLATLEAHAFPKIGGLRVDEIGTAHVLNCLQPIWLAKPETARRVRQRIGLVLDWSKAKGYRAEGSPTR